MPVLAKIEFILPSALRTASVSQSTTPVSRRTQQGQPSSALPTVTDVSRSVKLQVVRGSQQRGRDLIHFKLPCHISRLLHCLSRLEKRNQKSKPVLKAVLSKRGKPAPPTSPTLPAQGFSTAPRKPSPASASFLIK